LDRKGTSLRKVGEPGSYRIPAISPQDENKIALEVVDPQIQNMDVYIFDATGNGTRFTFSANRDYTPVWSFDGSRILYGSERPDGVEWYIKPSSGAAEEVLAFKATRPGAPASWTRDGVVLYNDFAGPSEIRAVNLTVPLAERKPLLVASSQGNDIIPRLSPDDRFVVYASDESGRIEIWVRPLNTANLESPASPKWMVSKNGAQAGGGVWRGNEIFFISADNKMMSVEVTTQPSFETKGAARELLPVPVGVFFFDVSKDGRKFLMPLPTGSETRQSPFQVVLNWTAMLKK
jgi:Tol biopolymer transport system component